MGAEAHPSAACPDDEVIALLVDGSLEPAEDAAVRAHLDACDACRVLFADVARALDSGIGARGAPRAAPAEHSFHKGDIFAGKYRIDKLLGKGGMGQVFAARHVELNKLVALKVMRPDMTKDTDAVRRFAREAKAAAALRSDHAVRILDVGRVENGAAPPIPYIVMEHLDGYDLGSISPKTLPVVDAVRYVRQACDALIDAHAVGIIHRDLKPHNLFLTRDAGGAPWIKVLDFGLAKARGDWKGPQDSSNTATNVMLGSPFFMSPEQIESAKSVDHRTDIWSLGATLYQLLTGGPPFLAPNVHIICARILTEDFPPARSKRPDVPKEIDDILRRCMNRDLGKRYQSVADLAKALDRLLEELVPTSAPTTVNDMLDPPTVALGGSRNAPGASSVSPSSDEDPTLGNERDAWRAGVFRQRTLDGDDTTAQILAPQRGVAPVTQPAPPPPPAAEKDTIPERRPPPMTLTTPFEVATPQRISTLPMPGAVPRASVQSDRIRVAFAVMGFVAVGATIVAVSLWRSESVPESTTPAGGSASLSSAPSPSALPTITSEPPATVAPLASTTPPPAATPVSSASVAATGARTATKPTPEKPPPKKPGPRPHPPGSTEHDPYAAP